MLRVSLRRLWYNSCRVLKPFAAPRPFCMALSPSVHWHACLHVAVLSTIFSFWISLVAIARWQSCTSTVLENLNLSPGQHLPTSADLAHGQRLQLLNSLGADWRAGQWLHFFLISRWFRTRNSKKTKASSEKFLRLIPQTGAYYWCAILLSGTGGRYTANICASNAKKICREKWSSPGPGLWNTKSFHLGAPCASAMETVICSDWRIMTVSDVYALQHCYLQKWPGWNWQVQESGEWTRTDSSDRSFEVQRLEVSNTLEFNCVLCSSVYCKSGGMFSSSEHVVAHYMAFVKTPKWIKLAWAVLSVRFKIGLKRQVKKNRNFRFPAQQDISA